MDKALFVIIFMYATSFSMLGAQYIISDVLGQDLTNFQGQKMKPFVLSVVNKDSFNSIQGNVTNISGTQVVLNNLATAAKAGFEVFQLVTGAYILGFLVFMGVPEIFVMSMMGVYGILAIMFIIGHIKDFV